MNFFFCYRSKAEGGPRRERRDGERGGRGQRDRGRGRGRPEVIQSHSIFEQGPAEMMMKKRGNEYHYSLMSQYIPLILYIVALVQLVDNVTHSILAIVDVF